MRKAYLEALRRSQKFTSGQLADVYYGGDSGLASPLPNYIGDGGLSSPLPNYIDSTSPSLPSSGFGAVPYPNFGEPVDSPSLPSSGFGAVPGIYDYPAPSPEYDYPAPSPEPGLEAQYGRPADYPALSATYTNERGDTYVASPTLYLNAYPYSLGADSTGVYPDVIYPTRADSTGIGPAPSPSLVDLAGSYSPTRLDSTGTYSQPSYNQVLGAYSQPPQYNQVLGAYSPPPQHNQVLGAGPGPGGNQVLGAGPGNTVVGPDGSVYVVGSDGSLRRTCCLPCPGVWIEGNYKCKRPVVTECIRRECTDWRACNRVRIGMSPLMVYETGDLLCPGVDVDKFKEQCQAPVFPNQWNHWRLYRTTRDNPTDQELVESCLAFLGKITMPMDMGKIRHEDIVVIANNDQHSNPWQTEIIKNRLECDQTINLAHSDFNPAYRTLYVRFVYRGSRTSIPWPVRKVNAIGLGSWCPLAADWILDSVFAPKQENVPAESSDPTLPSYIDRGLPNAPELSMGQKAAVIGLGIGALALALGYGIRSVR